MMKIKRFLPIFIAFTFCISLVVISLTAGILNLATTTLLENIDITSNPAFSIGDFNYYYLDNTANARKVAVAYNGNATSATRLIVDPEVTDPKYPSDPCTVTAVAYAGFRYCKAGAIELPYTITEIGAEAFAYCTNITTFKLPYEVTVIPKSAFLDCRKLETFYYTKLTEHVELFNYQVNNQVGSWVSVIPEYSFAELPTAHSFRNKSKMQDGYLYLDTQNKNLYSYIKSTDVWTLVTADKGVINPTTETVAHNTADYYIYSYSDYPNVTTNDKVTEIKDHAFDSCVSLTKFNFSKKLSYIRQSAFQRCRTLNKLYLPNGDTDLFIESYAFSDCSGLDWIYFEYNLKGVEDYAFTGLNASAKFHYGYNSSRQGDSKFTPSTDSAINAKFPSPNFASHWRSTSLKASSNTKIPFEIDIYNHLMMDEHPEIVFSIETDPIYLDCQVADPKTICLDECLDENDQPEKYAVIRSWSVPDTYSKDYWESGGLLTIPEKVSDGTDEYVVKVIGKQAFENQTAITSITFNDGLVQICEKAFYKCKNIGVMNFEEADDLKEVGNRVFNDKSGGVNTSLTTLHLSSSIEYFGKYAFYGFTKVKDFSFTTDSSHPSVLVLGGYSFARLGQSISAADCFDLTLPCTLDDAKAVEANINPNNEKGENNDYNGQNWAAIGPYCFGAQSGENTGIKSIKMEECNHTDAQHNHGSGEGQIPGQFQTSLAPNAFGRSFRLTRFESNKNLCYIGADTFKDCNALREVFFATAKAESSGKAFPWATKGDFDNFYTQSDGRSGVFSGTPSPNLLIYLDNENLNNKQAPGSLDSKPWASESGTSYPHQLDETNYNRSSIPIIDNVNFTSASGMGKTVLYWVPGNVDDNNNNNDYGSFLAGSPSGDAQYNGASGSGCENGLIVFAKTGTDSYSAVKYYYNASASVPIKTIDLTKIVQHTDTTNVGDNGYISNQIDVIGAEAFAHNDAYHRGLYFILPNSVKEIQERAFYRKAGATNQALGETGVRIVTYRDDNGAVVPLDNSNSFASVVSSCNGNETNATTKLNIKGYCNLPDSVTRIERNAFYNNVFGSVSLGANLSFVGKSPFYSHFNNTALRSHLSSITFRDSIDKLYAYDTTESTWSEISSFLTGSGDPDATTGIDGDYYVKTSNYAVYYKDPDSVNDNKWTLKENTTHSNSAPTVVGTYHVKTKSSSLFNESAEGIYYTNATYKTLLYQSQKDSSTSLSIASGTKAIGMHAVANTSYQTITLNKELTHIYGGAFQNCMNLETINLEVDGSGHTALKYISAYTSTDELWQSNLPFDVHDYVDSNTLKQMMVGSQGKAFMNCTKLATFNFTKLNSLIKIGPSAFQNCKSLNTMMGTNTYTYIYKNKDGSSSTVSNVSNGVLDLSNSTDLISIGANAFVGCTGNTTAGTTGIKYLHLPTPTDSTNFTISGDLSEGSDNKSSGQIISNNGTTVLVGEVALEACFGSPTALAHKTKSVLESHYNPSCFGDLLTTVNNHNVVYYRADSASDLITNSTEDTLVKYWHKDGTTIYLFDSCTAAQTYFNSL